MTSAPGRLVVVSNRLPLTLRRSGEAWSAEPSSGGLATALAPIMARTRGLWLGWPGEAPASLEPAREALLEEWERSHGYAVVDLPRDVGRRFYEGYANQTLWPLFHQFPSRLVFDHRGWDAYCEANRRFRDAVLARRQPGDDVWVHDYHLLLLPGLLREAAPDARVGFFLHIPFPSSEVFRVLPRREELLHGMLGADFLAFHTHSHLQHFRSSLLRVLGIESRLDRVVLGSRSVRLAALPIGVAADGFLEALDSPGVEEKVRRIRSRFAGQRILLGVDRLDYTKGIPERLRTFRRLLERAPELREKVVLVQVAVPSRERVAGYAELRREVGGLVGELNGDFGSPGWTPVVYMRRGISRADLVALYATAAVGWVAPLRDGMNLVAKEYVLCQRGGDGALLLSEFAGAAEEMGEAFLINPYDEDRNAATLERILGLPADERRERMEALYRRVRRNDAFAWSERFMAGLEDAATARAVHARFEAAPLPVEAVLEAYAAARRRFLFLDYDGTLVGFARRPREATPPPELVELLTALAAANPQRLVIVSGRPRADLAEWFAGVPGLLLAAEHGALLWRPEQDGWEPLHPTRPASWKLRVLPVLEHFVDRTPGSFVEEKEYSLVWHHRMADPEFGEWLANELVANLEGMLAETELKAVRGHKSVEVRLVWAHKGEVVSRLLADGPPCDFLLGVGDDRTDEDLFESLPAEAWTIHVGDGPSRARYRLGGPGDVRALLQRLRDAG